MKGKQQLHSNETDITKHLVLVFAILVVIVVARILGGFSKEKTSTSSRAAVPNSMTTIAKQQAVYHGEKTTTINSGTSLYDFCKIKASLQTSSTSTVYEPKADQLSVVQYWWNGCATNNGQVSIWSGFTTYATDVYPQYVNCCLNINAFEARADAFCNSFNSLYDANGNLLTGSNKPEGKCLLTCDAPYTRKMRNTLTADSSIGYTPGCDYAYMNKGLYEKTSGICCFK